VAETEFVIDVAVPSSSVSSVEAAANSVAKLAKQLEASEVANAAAAEAVKAGEAAYRQAEAGADRAAKALEKLNLAVDAQRTKVEKLAAGNDDGVVNIEQYRKAKEALDQLTQRQTEAAAKSAAMAVAVKNEAASLDGLKVAADKASKAEEAAGKKLEEAKKAEGSGKVNEMAEAFTKLGGPLGQLGGKAFGAADGLKKLRGSLGDAGPYAAVAIAIVAVVAGIAALGVAAVSATVKIASWAVSLADASRSASLMAAGIARSVKGGADLEAKISDLNSKLPLTEDELLGLAKPLADAGLRGKALADALQKAGVKAATLKFGPNFQDEMLSLNFQSNRLKSSISKIFSGLKIDPFLKALERVVDLFDENDASAKAIKAVFESMFQPLIDGVTAFIPKMVSAFIQFEILVLKALIAIKPFGSTILSVAKIFGIMALAVTGLLAVAIGVVIASFAALAIGAGIVATAIVALAAFVVALGVQAWNLAVAVKDGAVAAFTWLKTAAQGAIDWLSGISLSEIGTQLIIGLVNGITGGAGSVFAAVASVASGAIDSAKKVLGIASPSKAFKEIGGFTAEGMAGGVDDGAPAVQSSMESMVEPPAPAAAPAESSSASVSSGGNVYHITINAKSGNADDIVDAFRAFLEGLGAQAGAEAPAS
jgi:hypothetical protein